jgi:hypothetical protein
VKKDLSHYLVRSIELAPINFFLEKGIYFNLPASAWNYVVVCYYTREYHKWKGEKPVSQTNSELFNINSVTKQPSIVGKDLHRRGLKHTAPLKTW